MTISRRRSAFEKKALNTIMKSLGLEKRSYFVRVIRVSQKYNEKQKFFGYSEGQQCPSL